MTIGVFSSSDLIGDCSNFHTLARIRYGLEKEKAKVQENLEKYTKEKLFEFCDLLDIPIVKTSAKKKQKSKSAEGSEEEEEEEDEEENEKVNGGPEKSKSEGESGEREEGSKKPRTLGPAMATNNYKGIWIYLTTPILGSLVGAGIYTAVKLPKEDDV
ncbi:unnamed protein product [Lactuca saligna]|uniref:Uncharacterized protein n=1 Tax=Lactuca saligna TaxID=75948 RepID=A0AA35VRA6_LACSI|nr:unnamed protein product [Lactuca saligna]